MSRTYVPGKRLYLIGRANAGDINTAVYCSSPTVAYRDFGGELADAYQAAYNAGARDIYLVRTWDYDTREGQYFSLYQALNAIDGRLIDIIVPIGAYLDEPPILGLKTSYGAQISLAQLVVDFCRKQWANGNPVYAIMSATSDYSDGYVDRLVSQRPSLTVLTDGEDVDVGWYLSSVVGKVTTLGQAGNITVDGAVMYAGMLASIDFRQGPTYSTIPSVSSLQTLLSDDQIIRLAQAGHVALVKSSRRGYVPHKAVTCASGNTMKSLHTVRIVQGILRNLHLLSEPYIGEPVGSEVAGVSYRDRAVEFLDGEIGVSLRSYDLDVTYGMHHMDLHLELTPMTEVTSVGATTRVYFETFPREVVND